VELCYFDTVFCFQAKIVTVVLKVHMHCEACAQEMKKRILKMKGIVQYSFYFILFYLGSKIELYF
jgi:hypothetical protein